MQGIGRITGAGRTGESRGAARGASGFRLGTEGSATAREASAAAEVAAPGLGLLALQESGSDTGRDAAAQRRGNAILEELNGLQCDLLAGHADKARLQRLAALDSGEEGADPALRDALRWVVLRARVEMARRGIDGPETPS